MANKILVSEKIAPVVDDLSLKSGITAKFLELQLGYKIDSFSIELGSKPGDNYMSDLFTIVVRDFFSEESRYYLIKCYPNHPSRQKFLKKANHFYHELAFYSKLAPDLNQILHRAGVQLALAPYHGGCAVNYAEIADDDVDTAVAQPKKLMSSLDNFILMTDLRKELGYQMPDSTKGLNADHVRLAFLELATLHVGSWAYAKTSLGEGNLTTKYPFLLRLRTQRKTDMWLGLLQENVSHAITAVEAVKGKDNLLSKALLHFLEKGPVLLEHFFQQNSTTEEELSRLLRIPNNGGVTDGFAGTPWRVVCHGDCWTNNLLFFYDNRSRKPTGAVLIDFPLAKVACPTLDLACLVYTSTRRDFRHSHLLPCLQAYHRKFIGICQQLNVHPPPNFQFEVLQNRFHTAKLIGFLIALISLPLNLVGECETAEISGGLSSADEHRTMGQMLKETCSAVVTGSNLYQEWIVELVEDLYDEGVI